MDIKLYGVKNSLLKTQKFKKSSFVDIQDYIKSFSKGKKIKLDLRENTSYDYLIKELKQESTLTSCKLLNNINLEDTKFSWRHEDLCEKYGVDFVETNTTDDAIEKFLDKYPILRHINRYAACEADVVNYIKQVS